MSKMKFDLDTAKWIADKAQHDISAFPVELVECDKCGAVFMPELGHDCSNVIEIDFNEVEQDEKRSVNFHRYSTILTLSRAGITTFDQLEKMSNDEIARIRGIGQRSYHEILEKLGRANVASNV